MTVSVSCSLHQDNYGYVCLLIQGATKDDAGWYTVSAKNEAGIVSCTARLDVYSEYPSLSPRCIIGSFSYDKAGVSTPSHVTLI